MKSAVTADSSTIRLRLGLDLWSGFNSLVHYLDNGGILWLPRSLRSQTAWREAHRWFHSTLRCATSPGCRCRARLFLADPRICRRSAFSLCELVLQCLQFLLGKLKFRIAVGGKNAHGADLHFLDRDLSAQAGACFHDGAALTFDLDEPPFSSACRAAASTLARLSLACSNWCSKNRRRWEASVTASTLVSLTAHRHMRWPAQRHAWGLVVDLDSDDAVFASGDVGNAR